MTRKIGILTGGGDAPGLNAVLRAVVKYSAQLGGWEIWGVHDSFGGLLTEPPRVSLLSPRACQGLLQRGGTVIGTSNNTDPFAFPMPGGEKVDRSAQVASVARSLGLDGLICIGGDGTQALALRLMQTHGLPVVGVPKTIDNDLDATDLTFGFQSAVDVATEALDRLHTTAESHDRVMLLEVMGRDTGHIALAAGLSGGADAILLPELPYSPQRVAAKVLRRKAVGRSFSIVVVAEGALPGVPGEVVSSLAERHGRLKAGGGAAQIAMKSLEPWVDAEMRATVLGHLQRGGSPAPFDRLLATRFGVAAVDLIAQGRWGEMVRLRHGEVDGVPIAQAVARNRGVDLHGELMRTARAVGVEFGG